MKIKNTIAISLVAFCAVVQGQQQKPESILIGPGDTVHVQVLDTPQFEQHARVSDSGNLRLIAGPDVDLLGKSPAEAAQIIQSALVSANIMLHPRVVVTAEEMATGRVFVIGEVKQPGAFSIQTSLPILQVLSMAGGLSPTADRKILIDRAGTTDRITYFYSNTANDAFAKSVDVQPGDTIYVPKAGIAYVLGDVKEPGGYTMTNNSGKLSVLELVARAGGASHSARTGRVKLIRKTDQGYVEIPLHLQDMMNGKIADMALLPDDIIYLPFSYFKNALTNSASLVSSAGTAAVYRF